MSTGIEWTDDVWNPTTGCDRVSSGCDRCYAMTMAKRLKAMGQPDYQTDGDPKTSGPGFGLAIHPHRLDIPLRWKKPRMVFVNSMSDLFHDQVPDEHITDVFAVMAAARQHTFQLLTKRHARMRYLLNQGSFWANVYDKWRLQYGGARDDNWAKPLPNLWLGVSVENQQWADIRIPALLQTPAAVRWLSCEPLLGRIDLTKHLHVRPIGANLTDLALPPSGAEACGLPALHWVVAGGESGPGARPMHPDWARSLRDQCQAAKIPFHFKQFGEWSPDRTGQHRITENRSRYEVKAIGPNGEPWTNETIPDPSWAWLYRKGKKAAGRELDGQIHDNYPEAVHA